MIRPSLDTIAKSLPTPTVNDMGAAYTPSEWDAWTDRMRDRHGNGNRHGNSLNVESQRMHLSDTQFGVYTAAIERHERAFGMPAPTPTIPGKTGRRLSTRFVEWMMGLPPGHVTAPEIGLSRVQQLRALGNGVVPQQAAAAIAMMADQYRQAEWGCVA